MEREEIISTGPVGSPHFDDEQTLLSARQVVPLAEIEHKLSSRRAVGFVGALVLAVAFGAGAALLVIRMKGRSDRTTADSSAIQTPYAAAEPAQAQTKTDSSVVVNEESEPSDEPITDEQSGISEAPRPVVERQSRSRNTSNGREPASKSSSVSNEPILVDQWEEKRQRRALRRERQRGNHHRGDLFQIRDIFEGPRP